MIAVPFTLLAIFAAPSAPMSKPLASYIQAREAEFGLIASERKVQLAPITDYIRKQAALGKPVKLTFICTHNSRRSHLSQVWAMTAAAHYGLAKVESYSGGTEATGLQPPRRRRSSSGRL